MQVGIWPWSLYLPRKYGMRLRHEVLMKGSDKKGHSRISVGAGGVRDVSIEGPEFALSLCGWVDLGEVAQKGEREGSIGWESPMCDSKSERMKSKNALSYSRGSECPWGGDESLESEELWQAISLGETLGGQSVRTESSKAGEDTS